MAFYCHASDEKSNIFTCKSSFTHYVPPQEKISLQDHIPDSVKEERKKDGDVVYLPGERLLIKLAKQRNKGRKKNNFDVDRVAASLSRVLSTF